MRKHGPRPKQVSMDAPVYEEEQETFKDRVTGRQDNPSDTMVQRETKEMLKHAIERLPEEHRVVVVLSEIQGLRYQEIGEILNIPVGTVKSRMHNAIERLKEMLKNVSL
jgi:RNA polymerase sigma-70 factor (ECF subfamily)